MMPSCPHRQIGSARKDILLQMQKSDSDRDSCIRGNSIAEMLLFFVRLLPLLLNKLFF